MNTDTKIFNNSECPTLRALEELLTRSGPIKITELVAACNKALSISSDLTIELIKFSSIFAQFAIPQTVLEKTKEKLASKQALINKVKEQLASHEKEAEFLKARVADLEL